MDTDSASVDVSWECSWKGGVDGWVQKQLMVGVMVLQALMRSDGAENKTSGQARGGERWNLFDGLLRIEICVMLLVGGTGKKTDV